ncbi:MAG: pseudouridine-5'-phosphate glycosidase [Phycisphaerales bacterium]|nr:MAG: pseudouridine-5'-phosphate glycosidase [Phycisphaerales bacterium]
MNQIRVHPEVDQALHDGRPIVALESAVTTAGLPRQPLQSLPNCPAPGWRHGEPLNLEVARLLERTVRLQGAIPATIALLDGRIHVGLEDEELAQLATDGTALKAGVGDLAHRMATGANAGTTVSATLAACMLPAAGPIKVFATGGIGGVHRRWGECPDISADLRQIATTPVCVVCAGAKAVLDVEATVEMLETLGIPVICYRTGHFPLFFSPGDQRLAAPTRLDDTEAVAALCLHHWTALGRRCGVILANPIPLEYGLDIKEVDQAVNMAEALANAQGITGRDRTPFLLSELARRTDGRSLMANIALLANNASLAAETAISLGNSADTANA